MNKKHNMENHNMENHSSPKLKLESEPQLPEYTISPASSSAPSPAPPPAPTPPLDSSCSSPSSSAPSLLPSKREREDSPESTAHTTKKRAVITPRKADISAENRLLLQLKDGGEGMKWGEIVKEFENCGWRRKEGLLRMRYRYLKENRIWWEDEEVDYLQQAIFEVESEHQRTKWESVAAKMLDLGATRKFSGVQCEKKWRRRNERKPVNTGCGKESARVAIDVDGVEAGVGGGKGNACVNRGRVD